MGQNISGYLGNFNPSVSATIANGQQSSSVVKTAGTCPVGIQIPAAFTGTSITFEVCDTLGGTYLPLYNSAGQVSYTVAVSRYVAIDPKDFQGVAFFKVKSGSAEGGARSLIISLKGL